MFLLFDFAVAGSERGVPAHSSCAEHERRWQAEDHVCSDLHQGYWPPFRQHRLQESRCRHEQEVFIFDSLSDSVFGLTVLV